MASGVHVIGLQDFPAKLQRAIAANKELAAKALFAAALVGKSEIAITIGTTEVDGEYRPPRNLGMYAAAWMALPTPTGAILGNSMPYAPVIEYGARPFHPPVAPLIFWAKRKFGLTDEAARGVGFAVAKTIGKNGIKPRHVLTNTMPRLRDVAREAVKIALDVK